MFPLNRVFLSNFLIALFLSFSPVVFADDTNALLKGARMLYEAQQDYINKSLNSDWRGLYERQHPNYKEKISFDEFVFFDGKVDIKYRNNLRASVSGGYAIPTLDYIRNNSVKKDMLGYPAPRKYLMTTNPLVNVKKVVIKKIEVTKDGKYGKATSTYIGKMTLPPSMVRALIKIPFTQKMFEYWENVDGRWYISVLKDIRSLSGNAWYHFIPANESEWESMDFVTFAASELIGEKR